MSVLKWGYITYLEFESFFGSCMNKENWKYERVGGREQSIFICVESEEEAVFGEVCECTKMGLATCFFPFLPFFIVTQPLSFALAAMMPCDSEWEKDLKFQSKVKMLLLLM